MTRYCCLASWLLWLYKDSETLMQSHLTWGCWVGNPICVFLFRWCSDTVTVQWNLWLDHTSCLCVTRQGFLLLSLVVVEGLILFVLKMLISCLLYAEEVTLAMMVVLTGTSWGCSLMGKLTEEITSGSVTCLFVPTFSPVPWIQKREGTVWKRGLRSILNTERGGRKIDRSGGRYISKLRVMMWGAQPKVSGGFEPKPSWLIRDSPILNCPVCRASAASTAHLEATAGSLGKGITLQRGDSILWQFFCWYKNHWGHNPDQFKPE